MNIVSAYNAKFLNNKQTKLSATIVMKNGNDYEIIVYKYEDPNKFNKIIELSGGIDVVTKNTNEFIKNSKDMIKVNTAKEIQKKEDKIKHPLFDVKSKIMEMSEIIECTDKKLKRKIRKAKTELDAIAVAVAIVRNAK